VADALPSKWESLDELSYSYILNRQLELLLFTCSSSEDLLAKIHHMEQAVPKVVVLLNRTG